jgi:hypothetical protein
VVIRLVISSKSMSDVYSPEEWRDLFKKAGGWTPLPFPDSKYGPGSIIKVMDDKIYWIDDLEGCGYPLKEFAKESNIPSITFTKRWKFNGSAIVDMKGIKAGPKFDEVSNVQMEVKEHGADAFRILKLKDWMADPNNKAKFSQTCMDQLLKPDYYLVTEAFRVSKAKYTLYNKAGAAIKIETPVLKDFVQVQPDVKYEVTSDGSLVIEQPVYFAVRKTARVGNDFDARGASEEADSKIEKLFFQSTGQ